MEAKAPEKPLVEHIDGLHVDTQTGEVIEPEQSEKLPVHYSDRELMYILYMLLDQKVDMVR